MTIMPLEELIVCCVFGLFLIRFLHYFFYIFFLAFTLERHGGAGGPRPLKCRPLLFGVFAAHLFICRPVR